MPAEKNRRLRGRRNSIALKILLKYLDAKDKLFFQSLLPLYRGGYRKLFLKSLFVRSGKRRLISPIPGYLTHPDVGYQSPLTDWKRVIQKSVQPKAKYIAKELTI